MTTPKPASIDEYIAGFPEDTQKILENRTSRLKLHDQRFKYIDPATLKEINNLFEVNILII